MVPMELLTQALNKDFVNRGIRAAMKDEREDLVLGFRAA